MQTSILSLMLAFGLPGANSCNAQQQDLPRVNQNPPVAAHSHHHADDADDDADDDSDADDDMDDADEADEAMIEVEDADAELPEIAEIDAECTQEQVKTECKAICGEQAKTTDGKKIVRLKEKDLEGKVQTFRLEPGSTVVLETKNGKQVVLRAQSPESVGLAQTDLFAPSMLSLDELASVSQPMQQPQDERVRELEQRVRELEAQLRERDGQRVRTSPRSAGPLGYAGNGQDEQTRRMTEEMRARASVQARDQAKQSRMYAEEMRKHGEEVRKHAQEQAEHWRALSRSQADDAVRFRRFAATPEGVYTEIPPQPAVPGEAGAPQAQGGWNHTAPTPSPYAGPSAPEPMKARKAPKPPKAMKPPMAPGPAAPAGADVHDMQALLEQMRVQMEEMRAQMQALREELQNAPQREMR